MAKIELRNLTKYYDDTPAVRGIDLDINDEEFMVFVGPSGCGKSTTLRMIAGLEDINAGEILIDGQVVNEKLPKDRDIAMVFQNYALYPHMTVFENMAFGLRQRSYPKAEIAARVEEGARILNISDLLQRKPRQLSGGQRQRVAMGRAIVRQPKVFLFDEPLSNLDAQLRVQMRTEIKKLRRSVRTTTVYVTHDQVEALTLADRIVVMNGGNIEQVGTPYELYHHPRTRFVASFIGSPAINFIPLRLEKQGGGVRMGLPGGLTLDMPQGLVPRYGEFVGREGLELGIRPEHVHEQRNGQHDPASASFDAALEVIEPMGADSLITFNLDRTPVCGLAKLGPGAVPGQRMRLTMDLSHMHVVEPASGAVL